MAIIEITFPLGVNVVWSAVSRASSMRAGHLGRSRSVNGWDSKQKCYYKKKKARTSARTILRTKKSSKPQRSTALEAAAVS